MDGSFACPACGSEIEPTGHSPGRQVRCAWCRTVVEIPFIPRALPNRRKRWARRGGWRSALRPHRWRLAWGATALLALVVGIAWTGRVVSTRWQSADSEAASRLLRASREAESAGRIGEALGSMEEVLALKRKARPPAPDLGELSERRDSLSRRDAEARLASLAREQPGGDPGQAVGHALTLLARAEKDPAVEALGDRIRAELERLRRVWAEADARGACQALAAGDASKAMALSERQYRTAGELGSDWKQRLQDDATTRAREVLARHGTFVEPIRGRFTFGTTGSYARQFPPIVLEGLQKAGFLPQRQGSPWDALWPETAPYRLSFEVVESQDEPYLGSPNRLSVIEAKVVMRRGADVLWVKSARATTTVPLPGLAALQASRLATSTHRSPDFERLLYDNARGNLAERLATPLRHLPAAPPTGPDPPRLDPCPPSV